MKIKIAIGKLSTLQPSFHLSGRMAVCLLSLVATAIGCGWVGTDHSVRFNDFQTEREMGRLPPLPTMADGLNDRRASWALENEDLYDYEADEQREEEVEELWKRAGSVESNGDLTLARDLLVDYLKRTSITRQPGYASAACQACRNSAIDRLDALAALSRGSSPEKVKAYLKARHEYEAEKSDAETLERVLKTIQSETNLKDNVAYLRAAKIYDDDFAAAAQEFTKLATRYPHSEKREAALFMAAMATMKSSSTYVEASGNSDYTDDEATPIEVDKAWHEAFGAFQKVMREYPHGRYFNDARGWLGYLLLRKHDRAGAMIEYYRLLASGDENSQIQGAFSLTFVRWIATEDEMSRVEKVLEREPQVALAYAYHNLYNYAIDPGSNYPDYGKQETILDANGDVDIAAEQRRSQAIQDDWQRKRNLVMQTEQSRVLNFAKRLLGRHPGLAVGGAFALRAGQASVELDDNQSAIAFAQRALRSGLRGDQRAQALWTLGIAAHRSRQFAEGRKAFETLLKEFPSSHLTEGARRSLAMIAEDSGDIDTALEQYVALDYDIDVAYLVDTLMTIEQLDSFIQRHPDSPKANEFTYALAVRYLRTNRWQDARNTLARVRTATSPDYNPYYHYGNCKGYQTIDCVDPKDSQTDADRNLVITPELVLQDVQTANDLEALQQKVSEAGGDEAKAEALYQYASYQYEASSLLFYNPLASPGYWNIGLLAGEGKYRVPNESQILWNATQERERLARSLNVYVQIADEFPQTRAARDSLYTAAVCHERLSTYNPYWRGIYQVGLHAGNRMVTYADVKATYPHYQLPRGTYGWQPATRTVNDGPGFQAPPKPRVRPTRIARVKSMARWLTDSVAEFWVEKGERWLTEAILLGLILIVGRVAARSRRRLRARMARQRLAQAKEVVVYPWLEMFWIDHVEPSRREQVKKYLTEKRQEFIDLAKDGRSWPVLVRSVVSHAALGGLLISLLWTIGSA